MRYDGAVDVRTPSPAPNQAPFEGPEKLLEIWWDLPEQHQGSRSNGHGDGVRRGLRTVPRAEWEAMLDIVRCKVLSVIEGGELDAYLLSESSLFIYPHKLILKTCGTTLNLLGLPRILEIAKEFCGMDSVMRCFYSRKSFMFPERQIGPHRDWKEEVSFLDDLFSGGAAYTVGKVNGDHWLLWFVDQTAPAFSSLPSSPSLSSLSLSNEGQQVIHHPHQTIEEPPDYTIEILMSQLSSASRANYFFPPNSDDGEEVHTHHSRAKALSERLGITSIFPPSLTEIDAYAFEPCGYSANALISAGPAAQDGQGYWTIHVTPEEGWSYASFECNVPLPAITNHETAEQQETAKDNPKAFPNLHQLIQRVVDIFEPGHLSLTLFVSNATSSVDSPIENAQAVFRHALIPKGYKRTDKITYEFSGYDLAFATFQRVYK